MADPAFWRGRRVLLTGHTGFKGAWCAEWLASLGADLTGFALAPDTPSLHAMLATPGVASQIGDLRVPDPIARIVASARPEIVLHMAAQPLVRRSYRDPVETYATNVMGTVHLMEALRRTGSARVILVVTSDKVYWNDESGRAFAEGDRLGGHDPYAASKAATETVVESYAHAFFADAGVRIATARGGNVIGGGDFSEDRLIPDIVRAEVAGTPVALRNPGSTRPWQHVLDCVAGYLAYAEALAAGPAPAALNFGPHDPADVMSVEAVTRALGGDWQHDVAPAPREMAKLAIDPSAARAALGWEGRLSSRDAIGLTAAWYTAWREGADMAAFTRKQIADYQAGRI